MNKTLPPSQKRASYQAHRRDFRWQILTPMIVVLILIIAASVAVSVSPAASASLWADVSTIWLLIPWLIFAFIMVFVLGGLIYGMAKLLQITPIYTEKLYNLIRLAGQKVENMADATVKPIFFVEGISASIKRIFQQK